MRAYVAARMEDQSDARQVREALREFGIEVHAKWIDVPMKGDAATDEERIQAQAMDLADVVASDVLVLWKPRSVHRSPTTGGHHVEVGHALALGKPVFVIGAGENVFHWNPAVRVCETIREACASVARLSPEDFLPNPQAIDSYQRWTLKPAKYPDAGKRTGRSIAYAVAGLVGETGELVEKILGYLDAELAALGGDGRPETVGLVQVTSALRKMAEACRPLEDLKREIRERRMNLPDMGPFPQGLLDAVNKELGDCAWYHARLPDELGLKSSTVLSTNVDKLEKRIVKGTLHGKGDER